MIVASHPRRSGTLQARAVVALTVWCGLLGAVFFLSNLATEPESRAYGQVKPPLQDARNPMKFLEQYQANPKQFVELKIVANTSYEQLMCVGYDAAHNELEAIVHVKRPTGYGGDLCSNGSQEYVRFFINYGSAWVDLGLTKFNVHDIPTMPDCEKKTDKPLHYAVRLPFQPKMTACDQPQLPRVRAILSWQTPPPPGAANVNWLPPYGNKLEHAIQLKPSAHTPVKPLLLAELSKTYAQSKVEPHRFGMTALAPLLPASGKPVAKLPATTAAEFKKVGLDGQAALTALAAQSGNISHEELECLGLDTNLERLAAIYRIKTPTGFSGTLCQHGSVEYVAFWADWDDKCKWTYLGTVKVEAHDFKGIPKDGLCYAAVLPVKLADHYKDCREPRIARVRAVLSWGTPPSITNPNLLPAWGNRLDAHVQLKAAPKK